MSALEHYETIVDEFFSGDATKMVFGFCISDCSGTGSNANGNQAATVMSDLAQVYPCNGGAFFWVAEHDTGASWSSTVNSIVQANNGECSGSSPPPPVGSPVAPPMSAPVSPPIAPPISPPVSPPVSPPSGEWVVSTANRCGASELDARGNCGQTCTSNSECGSGEYCWGVHANYCDSKDNFDFCSDLSQANALPRCGVNELEARERCGNTCSHCGRLRIR